MRDDGESKHWTTREWVGPGAAIRSRDVVIAMAMASARHHAQSREVPIFARWWQAVWRRWRVPHRRHAEGDVTA